ncbi:MAG: FAD-dependent oxidoreductase, partial [Pseudomonadota bacterium]
MITIAGCSTPLTINSKSKKHSAIGYIRTNWGLDPYSYGSYSFFAKGSEKADARELALPIKDKLFFIGEATHHSYHSTVHAAFETGLSTVAAIKHTKAKHIAVIGAGVSGLTTATKLVEAGHKITLLEARHRIGGRIWSDNRLGIPLDLGASWIHGIDGNPIAKRAQELDLETITTNDHFIVRGKNGRVLSDDLPHWLEEVVSVQHDFGAHLDEINMYAYQDTPKYGGGDAIFKKGYAQLFKKIPNQIDLHLNWDVREINYEDTIQIVSRTGKTLSCDSVIISVPLGVLKSKSIKFYPSLPTRKQIAIKRLGMGLLDKVYLKFEDVFWDRHISWIITPENGLPPGQFNQWF